MNIYNRRDYPPGFYVYIYLREYDSKNGKAGTPYYIGKGSTHRAWDRWGKSMKAPRNEENIIIYKCDLSESEAYEQESLLIEQYGRIDKGTGILRNKTDGGDGSSGHCTAGWLWTDESKEQRKGKGNPAYGKPSSKKQKEIASKTHKGVPKPKKLCRHCNQYIAVNCYTRWHGDQCKSR